RARGRRCALAGAAPHPGLGAANARPDGCARGGRRVRRGDDRGGPAGRLHGHAILRPRLGRSAAGRGGVRRRAAGGDLRRPVPDLSRDAQGHASGVALAAPRAQRSGRLMPTIAIMGDRFMRSDVFETAIRARCRADAFEIRKQDLPWPDVPMEHGYAKAGLDGLKEYLGEPDDVVAFVGDADIFVTHLAPLSAAMMDRLPMLRLVAVSRGGPVNIDMRAARERRICVVNTPGRNASAVAEFTIGAI